MRVALYIGQLDVGGAEGQILLLARGLAARGWEVRVLTEVGRLGAVGEDVAPFVVTVPARPRVRRLAVLRRFLGEFRPDLLHCQLTSANLWGTLAAGRGLPVIISFLSVDPWKRWYHLWVDRWLAARAAGVMVNAEGVRRRYASVLGPGAAAKVKLIYNGVDTERFRPGRFAREREAIKVDELHVPAGAPVVINVANFFAVKDHRTLLSAFARASAGREAAHRPYLVLAGDGPERENVVAEAKRLGVAEFVRFVGRVREVERYLAAADIFVLSSRAEGFSNALLEAMAAGLACVATDVGGNAEALGEGAGVVVAAEDAEALGRALGDLLDDEAKRETFARRARIRAERKFGLARMVDETAAWYIDLLEGAKKSKSAHPGVRRLRFNFI